MSNDVEHLDRRDGIDIDEYHLKSDGRMVDTLSYPGQEREAQSMAIEADALNAVARELARLLNVSNKPISKVIQSSSETIFRTFFVPKNATVKVVNENYERSRLWLWVPDDVIASVVSVAISRQIAIDYNSATNVVSANAVLISDPQEFRTVRDLWATADAGDTTADYAILCVVEEFIA